MLCLIDIIFLVLTLDLLATSILLDGRLIPSQAYHPPLYHLSGVYTRFHGRIPSSGGFISSSLPPTQRAGVG